LLSLSAPPVPHKRLVTSDVFARSLAEYGSPERARTADLMINSHFLIIIKLQQAITTFITHPLIHMDYIIIIVTSYNMFDQDITEKSVPRSVP
jgi:hypothetical protein